LLGETEDREALASSRFSFEPFVLQRETALAGDVDGERHLAAKHAKVGGCRPDTTFSDRRTMTRLLLILRGRDRWNGQHSHGGGG
jgi:hypothetical protein